MPRTPKILASAAALAFAAGLLAGCGQRGPLYLPESKPAAAPQPSPFPSPPATAASSPATSRP